VALLSKFLSGPATFQAYRIHFFFKKGVTLQALRALSHGVRGIPAWQWDPFWVCEILYDVSVDQENDGNEGG
jgi:hypothetical protein